MKTLYSIVLVRFADHLCLFRFLMNSRWTRDNDGFFSRRLACRTNDRSCNSTDSSLVTVDYQCSSTCWLACVRFMFTNVWHDKNLYGTNLCDLPLTRIIHINKSHAEICHFRVSQSEYLHLQIKSVSYMHINTFVNIQCQVFTTCG